MSFTSTPARPWPLYLSCRLVLLPHLALTLRLQQHLISGDAIHSLAPRPSHFSSTFNATMGHASCHWPSSPPPTLTAPPTQQSTASIRNPQRILQTTRPGRHKRSTCSNGIHRPRSTRPMLFNRAWRMMYLLDRCAVRCTPPAHPAPTLQACGQQYYSHDQWLWTEDL